jgi:hypothetical protein
LLSLHWINFFNSICCLDKGPTLAKASCYHIFVILEYGFLPYLKKTSSHARAHVSQLTSFALFQKITYNILNNFLGTIYSDAVDSRMTQFMLKKCNQNHLLMDCKLGVVNNDDRRTECTKIKKELVPILCHILYTETKFPYIP